MSGYNSIDWRGRAIAAEDEVARLRGIEGRETIARILARHLWLALKARSGYEAEALFSIDAMEVVDPAFDAMRELWERHRVTVVPCRTVFDNPHGPGFGLVNGPSNFEMYYGRWPDGSTRNLTRAQLLMMGGQDPEEPADA